jgi:hypothetical protein
MIVLQFFSSVLGETLIFSDALFQGSLAGIQDTYSDVQFNQEGNNFPGTIFRDTGTNLGETQEVIFDGVSKFCDKQIKGTYYNSIRGTRLRPLDQISLDDLKTVDSSYNTLALT